MRLYRILGWLLPGLLLSVWAAPPTDNEFLNQVRQQIKERQSERAELYQQYGYEEGWSDVEVDVETQTAFQVQLDQLQAELAALEAEISLIKINETHGLDLAISGMLIVFMGLALISLFIAGLPKALALMDRSSTPIKKVIETPAAKPVTVDGLDAATLAALALVLHAESERASGQNLKVTLGLNPSPWALSNQMRVLPGRIQS